MLRNEKGIFLLSVYHVCSGIRDPLRGLDKLHIDCALDKSVFEFTKYMERKQNYSFSNKWMNKIRYCFKEYFGNLRGVIWFTLITLFPGLIISWYKLNSDIKIRKPNESCFICMIFAQLVWAQLTNEFKLQFADKFN